ncbi:unnamed protein product [Callosobruchus maculatus]|uniref:Uncharacterized protein n=1 Tax=Callosobruchus maculatus TaxID=64391 RepID=A0A653CTW9_CALMS|nr:unnamed protein product [Callosobruchus maculatus]
MPQSALEQVKHNTEVAKQTIDAGKNELAIINERYNSMLAEQLRTENAALQLAVEEAKKKLIQLEVKNGKKQISVPNRTQDQGVTEEVEAAELPAQEPKDDKDKKEKKPKIIRKAKPRQFEFGKQNLMINLTECL